MLVELDAEPDGGVRVLVADGGTWQPAAADAGFRGRGLTMIAALADDVDVRASPAGTTLRFRLPPPAAVPTLPVRRQPDPTPVPAALVASDLRGRRCLELLGDLDLAGVQSVGAGLLAEAAAGPVVLDLTRLGFVASIGAGLLFEAVETGGDGLEIVVPADGPARRLLDLTGLTDLLEARRTSAAR